MAALQSTGPQRLPGAGSILSTQRSLAPIELESVAVNTANDGVPKIVAQLPPGPARPQETPIVRDVRILDVAAYCAAADRRRDIRCL